MLAKASNKDIQVNGQSGGVTAVLSYLFRTKRIDAALLCRHDVNGTGKPCVILDESQLYYCQKSSYTPLPLLCEIDKLKLYSSVAVVGLPCHLSGLENIMRIKQISIKYKLGLICDRTLCSTISEGIKKYLNEKNDVIIKWRDKNAKGFSYINAPISVTLSNGTVKIIQSKVRQNLKGIFTAPRCLVCPDKLNSSADLVFGDPWNITTNNETGESLVIANNTIGKDLLLDVTANDMVVVRKLSPEELNKSQHISERARQISLYSRILSRRSNQFCFLMKRYIGFQESCAEMLRALYNVCRFNILEAIPVGWIVNYTARLITKLNDEQ